MNVTLEQVLQDLYDSEINVSIDWEWDGGIDVTFLYPIEWCDCENTRNVSELPAILIKMARKYYPNSTFVHKYKEFKSKGASP